jgi:hypothetical protein
MDIIAKRQMDPPCLCGANLIKDQQVAAPIP